MNSGVEEDLKVLEKFIEIYCKSKHRKRSKALHEGLNLCDECQDTLYYASHRRKVCPLDPKPSCKNCEIHCYKPEYRSRIKKIMRYSGLQLILRGRIDLILHYLF